MAIRYLIPIALLLAALALGGCVPYPHHETYLPAVTGKLHRNGRPVANATVYYAATATWNLEKFGEDCRFRDEELRAVSDSAGEFRFPAQTTFKSFALLYVPGGHWGAWQVCIADGAARHQGWYEMAKARTPMDMADRDYSREIALDCNLESAPREVRRNENLIQKGICTNIGSTSGTKQRGSGNGQIDK